MPDMLTVLAPSMTKLSKDVEDVLKVWLLVIIYHVVHLVNMKPETERLLMMSIISQIIPKTFLFCLSQLPGPL